MTTVDVHYGHLCTIRVTRYDPIPTFDGNQAVAMTFQVQANKTRAYRTFDVRTPLLDGQEPIATVRAGYKQLTGHNISLDGSGEDADATPGQSATLQEIKEFVRSETQKLNGSLALDII